jgi:hypothetical protein
MICFWKIKNTTMAGIEATRLTVMGSVNSERFAPWNWGIPTGKVIIFSLVIDKKGQRKLFQELVKVNIPTAAS